MHYKLVRDNNVNTNTWGREGIGRREHQGVSRCDDEEPTSLFSSISWYSNKKLSIQSML
jgi:hypothetical protein